MLFAITNASANSPMALLQLLPVPVDPFFTNMVPKKFTYSFIGAEQAATTAASFKQLARLPEIVLGWVLEGFAK